jgi:hypothetical protein
MIPQGCVYSLANYTVHSVLFASSDRIQAVRDFPHRVASFLQVYLDDPAVYWRRVSQVKSVGCDRLSHCCMVHVVLTLVFSSSHVYFSYSILVPIFLGAIPVPLSQDSYPIAIMLSFLVHEYFPVLRGAMKLSPIFKGAMIVMYEVLRAAVVVKLTSAAGKAISPSEFNIALFGPIFCGTIAGCGGAFLPLNKGLDPIKTTGLGQPMMSAFIGATFYHLFVNTQLSAGVVDVSKKAQVIVATFFIAYNLYYTFTPAAPAAPEPVPTMKVVKVKVDGKKSK